MTTPNLNFARIPAEYARQSGSELQHSSRNPRRASRLRVSVPATEICLLNTLGRHKSGTQF